MQYTEKELQKLISEVETQFASHLAKNEENFRMAKSEDGEKKPEAKDEKKPEAKEGESPAAEAKAPAEGEKKPEGEAAPAAAAPAEHAGHDYDDEDMEHMKKMYMSMSEGELKAHHDCIASLAKCGDVSASAPKGALGAKAPDSNSQPAVQKSEIENENPVLNSKPQDKGEQMFNDKKNGGIEAAAPHNAVGPKSPASDANGAKINKSEHDRRNGGKIEEQAPANSPGAKSPASKAEGVQMQKSEQTEVELLKSESAAKDAKIEELKKNLEGVSAFITKLVEKRVAPAGKAITSLDVIAKSEGGSDEKTLSKSEIDAVLSKKTMDPKLEKSDRDLINAYYLSGASINSISHLLK
jgi:hypothetical protein